MPLELRRGRVTAIAERVEGLVRLEVEGRPCVAYPRLTGPVALGDDVVVNVQAVELGLGSGGFDVLHVNLTRGLGLAAEPGAHVMKLPYTSLQHAVVHAEESGRTATSLDGLPVVCCTLHSQLAPVCAGIGRRAPRRLRSDSRAGRFPSRSPTRSGLSSRERCSNVAVAVGSLRRRGRRLRERRLGALWCAGAGYEVVVCALGPGIVGTGTPFGHGAVAAAEAIAAARALSGRPILAVRASEADARPRHAGVSHHTIAVLNLAGDVESARLSDGPEADGLESGRLVETTGWREACEGLPLSHMGRGPDEDALFFETAFAAGRLVHEPAR